MKFSISTSDLKAALQRVIAIVPSKSAIPVLENILLELSGNVLRLTATDLTQTVVTTTTVSGTKNDAVALPAKKLFELVKALPEGELQITIGEKHRATLKTERGEYKISGMDPDEFPQVAELKPQLKFNLYVENFARQIATVAFAVSPDELRAQLMGVLLDARATELRLVATDGHRLTKVCDRTFSCVEPVQVIVPEKALAFVARNTGACHVNEASGKGEITVSLDANSIKFKLGDTVLYSRLIAGTYPNYERVVPAPGTLGAVVEHIDAAELLSMLQRAKIFAHEITALVSITISSGEWRVNAQQEGGNTSQEQITVQYDAENGEITIGINANYMIEIIKHLDTERLIFRFKDSNSPMIIEPEVQRENEHVMALLMPIRLNE